MDGRRGLWSGLGSLAGAAVLCSSCSGLGNEGYRGGEGPLINRGPHLFQPVVTLVLSEEFESYELG